MTTPPPPPPLVSVAQLAAYAALPTLTAAQSSATQAHLDGLVAGLERALGRPLTVRLFREVTVVRHDGRILLTWTPVVEIVSVGGVLAPVGSTISVYGYTPGVELEVVYRAGIDGTTDPHLRAAVMDKALPFVKTLLADAASSATSTGAAGLVVPSPPGGVKTFSVEGLNVTYESATERTAQAMKAAKELVESRSWSDTELGALGLSRLRKRVVA